MYECCKMVGGTSCGLGVGRQGVPLVYECCKIVGCMSVVRWWVVLPVGWG